MVAVKVLAASISYLEMIHVIARFNLRAPRIDSNNLNVSFMQAPPTLALVYIVTTKERICVTAPDLRVFNLLFR